MRQSATRVRTGPGPRSTRRGFLRGVVTPLALLALGGWPARATAAPDVADALAARARHLLRALRLDKSAPRLGRAYLASVPEEASIAALLTALESEALLSVRGIGTAGERQLRESAARDFAAGRTAELDGWVLSLVEARVCALASLA